METLMTPQKKSLVQMLDTLVVKHLVDKNFPTTSPLFRMYAVVYESKALAYFYNEDDAETFRVRKSVEIADAWLKQFRSE